MTPRAFVTGATGFVGRAVVQALVARGVPTVAHVRPDSKKLDAWRGRLGELGATVDASAWDAAAMTAALRARWLPWHLPRVVRPVWHAQSTPAAS